MLGKKEWCGEVGVVCVYDEIGFVECAGARWVGEEKRIKETGG
jgi:hypothetical protein